MEKQNWKEYSTEEVKSHNTREDLWITIDGVAYDVTKFVEEHP